MPGGSAAAAHVEWLPELAKKRKLDLGLLLAVFQSLPIRRIVGDSYGQFEEEARRQMAILLRSQQPINLDSGGIAELGPQRKGLVNS